MMHEGARIVMDSMQMQESLDKLANDIHEQLKGPEGFVLIGIQTGGVHLAKRIRDILAARFGIEVPVGELDINLYRDDWTRLHTQPLVRSTSLPFAIDDREVVLVDDVLYTGRTIRAALNALMDYGRPKRVQVAVLVDRGLRELPICAQFTSLRLDTTALEQVNVNLVEKNVDDSVVLEAMTS